MAGLSIPAEILERRDISALAKLTFGLLLSQVKTSGTGKVNAAANAAISCSLEEMRDCIHELARHELALLDELHQELLDQAVAKERIVEMADRRGLKGHERRRFITDQCSIYCNLNTDVNKSVSYGFELQAVIRVVVAEVFDTKTDHERAVDADFYAQGALNMGDDEETEEPEEEETEEPEEDPFAPDDPEEEEGGEDPDEVTGEEASRLVGETQDSEPVPAIEETPPPTETPKSTRRRRPVNQGLVDAINEIASTATEGDAPAPIHPTDD